MEAISLQTPVLVKSTTMAYSDSVKFMGTSRRGLVSFLYFPFPNTVFKLKNSGKNKLRDNEHFLPLLFMIKKYCLHLCHGATRAIDQTLADFRFRPRKRPRANMKKPIRGSFRKNKRYRLVNLDLCKTCPYRAEHVVVNEHD